MQETAEATQASSSQQAGYIYSAIKADTTKALEPASSKFFLVKIGA